MTSAMDEPKANLTTPVDILVAEDSPTQAAQLTHHLSGRGYQVTVARNGREALTCAMAKRPAIVITDIVMPEMDGYTLCKAIKSEPSLEGVPVILLTSLSGPQDVLKGLDCGADNFIQKPYDHRYLLSRVEYILMNLELRRNERMQVGVQLYFGGQTYFITAEKQQILDLLISTYEGAIQINQDLAAKQLELARAKDELEARVAERTSQLASAYQQLEREFAERERLQREFALSQKMEAIGRLAAGIAHDFNNLLTVVNGYCSHVLERLSAGEPVYDEIGEIGKAGERAATLTRQLLAFSRKQIFQPRVLDLNAIVADMSRMLRRVIGEDIDLLTSLDPQLKLVKVDSSQMEQIIMNLAVNARDAMPHGGKLTIETSNVAVEDPPAARHPISLTPGWYVMVAVTDTGMGMDAETQARIFEPFFTTKGPGKGTGLGLSTVYGIVEQTGGKILVSSEPGHGTVFKMYFTVATEPAESQLVSAPEPLRAPAGETILLVEDEPQVRSLARTMLTRRGYRVLEAACAEEALDTVRTQTGPIDLLLTDVVMPQMSGVELHRKITAMRGNFRVLYMSGYTETGIVDQGVLTPGTSFLQKPFTAAALDQKVREALSQRGQTSVARN